MAEYYCLEDRVLIRPIKKTEPEKTKAGIIKVELEKEVAEGEVVQSGNGYTARETGVFIPNILHKGDIVLYGAHAGIEIEIENGSGKEAVRLMREGDCLCVIKKAKKSN